MMYFLLSSCLCGKNGFATTAAADTNCTAVALAEPSAEVVSFRWH